MVYCSNCGTELREEAKFCDKCGSEVGRQSRPVPMKNEYSLRTEDVVRSTKIYVSQQRLYAVLGLIFGGIFFLIFAAFIQPMPSMDDPFGPANDYSFNYIVAAMGIGCIIFGIVLYTLGREIQDEY